MWRRFATTSGAVSSWSRPAAPRCTATIRKAQCVMDNRRPTVRELANGLMDVFPKLDDTKRRVALSTYRRLARGIPASLGEIAADVGGQVEEVRRILGDWIGVYTNEEKRVIGFWGLAIAQMKHRFELDGALLHTWCTWDTLFLPELP